MPLETTLVIPGFGGPVAIDIKSGQSIVFIGANGAGKTRLGVLLDAQLSTAGIEVHRVAAHRSLTLNPAVVPPSLEVATNRLLYGNDTAHHSYKSGYRYSSKPETALLSDFDHIISALYAENNDVSIRYRQQSIVETDRRIVPSPAKIDRLKLIWEKVLPHRELIVLSGNIKTKTHDGHEYSASDMSDGERVVFYLIGQALIAKPDTLLIFDEPELHINKSILAKMWDEIESVRSDCCFLYITHDVEFASSRHAATKFALRNYRKIPSEAWDIELIPLESAMPDDVVSTIVGSRRPILFVEGDGGSLDSSLYRRVYDQFTVVPVGSCDNVIHTVTTFAARPQLHRIGCAGLVDADGRTDEEAAHLASRGIYRLPVSEVENLILLPRVFLALAEALQFTEADAQAKLQTLQTFIFTQADQQMDAICLRHTARRVDAEMKKMGLAGKDISNLIASFHKATAEIDPNAMFELAKTSLRSAISARDYEKVLLHYDNKGLLSEAARQLGYSQKSLEEFIGRSLRSTSHSALRTALTSYLPTVTPRP